MFPFYWNGIQYYECIKDPWWGTDKNVCAVTVDEKGKASTASYCAEGCPGNLVLYVKCIKMHSLFSVEVCPCKFPFTYNGTQHDGCITHDNDGTPWCDIGNGEKGNCTSCPGKLILIVIMIKTNLCHS